MGIFSKKSRFLDDDGSASVEFVVVFPVVIGMVLLIFEAGWVMTKIMMLDRGLDIAMRDIRLGVAGSSDYDTVRTRICNGSKIFYNCESNLKIQMEPYTHDATWVASNAKNYFPWDAPACTDDVSVDFDPVTGVFTDPDTGLVVDDPSGPGENWNPGVPDTNMFLRVCITHVPIFPGLGSLLLSKGVGDADNPLKESYQLIAFSAFRNES